MKISDLPTIACLAVALLSAEACNREATPVRTRGDIAADSALAADLAQVNRDTLLVDSIGQYRPAEGGAVDTGVGGTTTPNPVAAATPPAATTVAPAPPATTTQRPPAAPPAPTASMPKRRITGNPCSSPTPGDQQACLRSLLAATDQRLNGIYRALLTEMRRQESVARGQPDPPSVVRLRAAQRAWLVNRDAECRRRGRGIEGQLWARPRARCLGEFSVRRANELADSFSRLTAH
jgi:uncharacterized protein YecT (DUF1311 family)